MKKDSFVYHGIQEKKNTFKLPINHLNKSKYMMVG